jgi:hypothetical protein
MERSPSPWYYTEFYPRTATLLLDRDGPAIASHFPMGNGPLVAEAPAMAAMLRDLVSGIPGEELPARAALILRQIERRAPREPLARHCAPAPERAPCVMRCACRSFTLPNSTRIQSDLGGR